MTCLWFFLYLSFSLTFADDLLVPTQQGTVRGNYLTTKANTTFRAFQGIPFAKPPLGPLRFQAPRSPVAWEGILDATKDASSCYIVSTYPTDQSEDCLYLNVFTPISSKREVAKLPVLLWIHGGGYTHGSSLYSNFGPDYLIEHNIIIVTVNYRLGPFGFLATGDLIIPGNAGHKDQAAAIKWTHDNIANFGGDQQKITIAGQSAGGSSVGYQLLHKGNEGLFRGAILQSGSSLSPWSLMNSSTALSYAFDLAKKIDSSVDLHDNTTLLRDFLLHVDSKVIANASAHTIISTPVPIIEPEHSGAFLIDRPYELLAAGNFVQVPIMIGTTSEEEIHQAANPASLKKYLDKYEANPEKLIPSDFKAKSVENRTLIGHTIEDLYLKNVPDDDKLGHIVRYLSHTTFTTPVIKHAELASNYTDVYFYVFSYDGLLGDANVTIKGADEVGHAEDCKYLWKKEDSSYSNADLSKYPKSDVLTLERAVTLWSNFVKYLNPTPEHLKLLQNITCPKFFEDENKYLDIGRNLEIKIKPKNPYYKAWSKYYDDWAERPFTTF